MERNNERSKVEPHLAGTLLEVLEAVSGDPEKGIYHVSSSDASEEFQSYRRLLDEAKAMSQVLYRRGIRVGTPLILCLEHSRPFLEIFWGSIFAGVLSAPLSPLRVPKSESMEARKILHVWNLLRCPIVADAENERAFAVLSDIFRGTDAMLLAGEDLIAEARMIDGYEGDRFVPGHEDSALLQFSSGSTGSPKGARLTHRNLLANIIALREMEEATKEDTLVTWLPYFHDFGLFGCHLMPMLAGMSQVKMDPMLFARRPFLWMEKIHEHRASITSAINTGIEHLSSFIALRSGRLPPVDLSCLKVWTVGAEMVSAASCRTLQEQLAPYGLPEHVFMPGYGLTETTLVATCHPRDTPIKTYSLDRDILVSERIAQPATGADAAEFISVGGALSYCRIRVVDGDGNILSAGRVGEIEIQGENVISDYYLNPEATAASFRDAWFLTGDLGFIDHDGDLCVVGRAKEIIIVRGRNYYPTDVERMAVSGIENAFRLVVACGVYDARASREVILMFFIPAKKGEAEEEVRRRLRRMNEQVSTLAGFSIDRFLAVRQGDIPRTSSGKVMRGALCEAYLRGDFNDNIIEPSVEPPRLNPAGMDHESIVLGVWSEILALPVESIGRRKNLFRLGGDSIRAMRLQARLEDIYHARMEASFCYLFPTVEQQIQYFGGRDFSIEPPQNELEEILRKIMAASLGVKAEIISVSADFMPLLGDMSKAFALLAAIRDVFSGLEIGDELSRFTTIRHMAEYLWPRVFGQDAAAEARYFPLMHFQETLYFHRKGFVRNEPSGLSCYIYISARMDGDFRPNIFDDAFNVVVARHPILRAVIDEEGDKPRFKVFARPPRRVQARHVDMSHIAPDEEREYILRRGRELNDHRFELGVWPLFFYEITRFSGDRYLFAMNIDHLLVDGYSYMQVFDELFNTYDRMVAGESWELPEVTMTFGDYARVEHLRGRTQEYKNALEFQLGLFRNPPAKAILPGKRNPALIKEVYFDTFYQEISPEIIEGLNAVAALERLSLNALLFAAYFKLMNAWTGQDDLIINMPVFNREQYFAGARKTVGSFIDIFPVRLQTTPQEPLIHIARKADAFTRKLLETPVSSIELARELFEREEMKATSMSSIIFSNSIGMYAGEVSGMKALSLNTPEFRTGAPGTFIDLVIYDYRVSRQGDDIFYFNWNYIRDLFDRKFIETLAGQYQTLLERIVVCPSQPDIAFNGEAIVPEQYRRLLARVNDTAHPMPETTLHGLIEESIRRGPDNQSMTYEGRSVSYKEFGVKAGQIAGLLTELGVARNQFVALFLNRCPEMLMGQLGIMKAGAAYLPIGVDYPAERIAYMLADSGARALLTRSDCLAALAGTLDKVEHIILLDEGATEGDIPAPLIGRVIVPATIYQDRRHVTPPLGSPDDLAYMIYTSGSTGKPKGSMISHRNIINFLLWVKEGLKIREDERFAFVTSYAFDMTMTSNWVPFLAGASLHILSEENTKDISALLRFISERDITFLNVTPSHFSLLAKAREFLGDANPPLPASMRIMLGGELVNINDLNAWLKFYPGHRFINEYGPTEATVASTYFEIPVNGENRIDLPVVPIGKPIFNTQVYVLNAACEHSMPGVPGELYIGGAGVSRGYHNKPEKTAEAFTPNPFKSTETLYRTGDVVRMTAGGDLEFLGREDHQINLRGYRIEAGDIESALRGHEAVAEAVVVPRKDTADSLTLVAFYTGAAVTAATLREHLAPRLPDYMIPGHFEFLAEMPCTPSGKLDKNRLPEVVIEVGGRTSTIRPVTDLEKRITSIWEDVLGVTGLGMTSNFWDVGGDSLKAMRLIMRMKKEGFIDFGLKEAFEYQTVASIVSRILKKGDGKADEAGIVALTDVENPEARLFCLPYACGNPTMFFGLSRLLPENWSVLAANLPGHGKEGAAMVSIPEIAALCVEQLAAFHDETPLFLLGYSFGGYLAYEMARRLEEKGRSLAGVVLVSCPPPGVTGGLRAILNRGDEEIRRLSKEIYHYDFVDMTEDERRQYMKTLRTDTQAMLDFAFGTPVLAPMVAIVGVDEEEKELRTRVQAWSRAFSAPFYEKVGGAHMLIKTHPEELAEKVRHFINAVLRERGEQE
ncbi:MAG: amino acid adenylation domain-containing protein [Desulfobulbaceae bacterium]|jgi:polyketide synthase PksJ|nr:amino acid adenylation domain-containing protein [Desulfobulbaceae bacterium]